MTTGLYLIALLPPELLREQIRVIKEEMKDRYGSAHALKSPAHITLQPPFRMLSQEEGLLTSVLNRFAGSQAPLPVELKGFDCFPPSVLFIRIEDHGPILELWMQLQAELALLSSLGIKGDEHRFHPHMTIATRDLKKQAFLRAWAEFKDRPFKASFEVHSIFLLKHNGQFWDILREFNFGKGS
ncbi:2'-5' RNA ligase family protein [Muriicola marianensis]|uniref:2'-5' RNA ligase n=1 Tax=Muriicola marianensis TaxID=1324801 RepID=A0ABQ1QYZ0_9FLAO|nr:2'-5' RNA ligase family protein [Muriicola marianensis]GGD50704.1 2'-5' RNA ligase [Muriicola marianensis]